MAELDLSNLVDFERDISPQLDLLEDLISRKVAAVEDEFLKSYQEITQYVFWLQSFYYHQAPRRYTEFPQ